MLKNERLPPELVHLSEEIGSFIEYWGFKKIEGIIWTHIFLAPRPLCASELATRSSCSKALVSHALQELLKYDVIHVSHKGRGRTVYFKANLQINQVIENVLRKRESKILASIRGSHLQLKEALSEKEHEQSVDPKKVKEMEQLLGQAQFFLTQFFKWMPHLEIYRKAIPSKT